MKYIGQELENFNHASLWRKYTISKVSKFLKGKNVLEVGSGIGSFSEILLKYVNQLTLVEPDQDYCNFLKKKFQNSTKVKKIYNGTVSSLKTEKFDVIIHFQVLEHIEDDNEEILRNLNLLNDNGFLIVCVPSFMSLYSKFDKAVGHFKRYVKDDFSKFTLNKSKIIKMFYIDSSGYIIYKMFGFFLNSEYPNKYMIMIWDKIFIPISIILDKIFFYKIGKNLISIIQKHN